MGQYSEHFFTHQFRVFGRLVLIPFLEGRRSPNGIEAQQVAEAEAEIRFANASSAIGLMVGFSRGVDHLCKTRCKDIIKQISFAEKVKRNN